MIDEWVIISFDFCNSKILQILWKVINLMCRRYVGYTTTGLMFETDKVSDALN